MTNVKTAISIGEPLYKEINRLSRRLRIPRSQLFALAAEEFVKRHRTEELLQQINSVYGVKANQEDQEYLRAIKRKHRQIAEASDN